MSAGTLRYARAASRARVSFTGAQPAACAGGPANAAITREQRSHRWRAGIAGGPHNAAIKRDQGWHGWGARIIFFHSPLLSDSKFGCHLGGGGSNGGWGGAGPGA